MVVTLTRRFSSEEIQRIIGGLLESSVVKSDESIGLLLDLLEVLSGSDIK